MIKKKMKPKLYSSKKQTLEARYINPYSFELYCTEELGIIRIRNNEAKRLAKFLNQYIKWRESK